MFNHLLQAGTLVAQLFTLVCSLIMVYFAWKIRKASAKTRYYQLRQLEMMWRELARIAADDKEREKFTTQADATLTEAATWHRRAGMGDMPK